MVYITLETDEVVEAVQNYVKVLTGKRAVVVDTQEVHNKLAVEDLEIKLEIDIEGN